MLIVKKSVMHRCSVEIDIETQKAWRHERGTGEMIWEAITYGMALRMGRYREIRMESLGASRMVHKKRRHWFSFRQGQKLEKRGIVKEKTRDRMDRSDGTEMEGQKDLNALIYTTNGFLCREEQF